MLVNKSHRHSVAFLCSPIDLRDRRPSGRKLSSPFDIFRRLRYKNEIKSVILTLQHTNISICLKRTLLNLSWTHFNSWNASCYQKQRFVSRSDRTARQKLFFTAPLLCYKILNACAEMSNRWIKLEAHYCTQIPFYTDKHANFIKLK